MYSFEEYHQSIVNLTNTLVIKIAALPVAINQNLAMYHGIQEPNHKSEWKYYLNLSGQKHSTNSDVKIKLRENGIEESLSVELLRVYRNTRKELLKNSIYYKELINKYPQDIPFIHGCMLPVDIDRAISAEDGTILTYNPLFLLDRELYLIKELQTHIKNVLARWNVKEYTVVDNLYVPSLLAVLYASIPNKIHNIRLTKIKTAEVHPFHMEHHLRSNMDIWTDASALNKGSLYWLYYNIDMLLRHVGKEETLHRVLDKIFDSNGIGVGEFIVKCTAPTVLLNSTDIYTSSIITNEPVLVTSSLNDSYIPYNGSLYSLDEIINIEVQETIKPDSDENKKLIKKLVDNEKDILIENTFVDQKTKVLDVKAHELMLLHTEDPVLFIIDTWLYNIATGRYNTRISFLDSNTNIVYTYTPTQAFLILIKMLLHLTGSDDEKLSTLHWEHIENLGTLDASAAVRGMFAKEQVLPLIEDIINSIPLESAEYYQVDDFREYIVQQFKFLKLLWISDCNAENIAVSANIKYAFNRLASRGTYSVVNNVPATIDSILLDNDVSITLTEDYDYYSTVKLIILTYTGVDIDFYKASVERRAKFINILKKLTSYSVQPIDTAKDIKQVYVPYTGLNLLYSNKGAGQCGGDCGDNDNTSCYNRIGSITVLGGTITNALEPGDTIVDFKSNNFAESSKLFNTFMLNNFTMCRVVYYGQQLTYQHSVVQQINILCIPKKTILINSLALNVKTNPNYVMDIVHWHRNKLIDNVTVGQQILKDEAYTAQFKLLLTNTHMVLTSRYGHNSELSRLTNMPIIPLVMHSKDILGQAVLPNSTFVAWQEYNSFTASLLLSSKAIISNLTLPTLTNFRLPNILLENNISTTSNLQGVISTFKNTLNTTHSIPVSAGCDYGNAEHTIVCIEETSYLGKTKISHTEGQTLRNTTSAPLVTVRFL